MATPAAVTQTSDRPARFDLVPLTATPHSAENGPRVRDVHAHGSLERLRARFHATRVSLIRFARADDTFEVVAATGALQGFPLLDPGVRFPLSASAIASAASKGRMGRFSETRDSSPVERMAVLLGFRSGIAVPLTLATTALGASIVVWDAAHPPAVAARRLMREFEPELLQALVAPDSARRHVLVCHEDPLTARGLGQIIEHHLGTAAEFVCAPNTAIAAATREQPSLIVLSDHLSESQRVDEVVRALRRAGTGAPVLVLARTDSGHALDSAANTGATGYLPLDQAAACLADTAALVMEGRSALPARSETVAAPKLSDREDDVLRCLERGLSDKQIAHELGVAPSTVKTHARGIYGKLGVTSRTSALHKARSTGLL